MKKASIVSLIALVAILISSCGSSNNVVNNHSISKRKYNKGFFFKRGSNFKTADAKVKDTDLKEDKSIAMVEKVDRAEARNAKKAEKEMKREMNVAMADDNNVPSHHIMDPNFVSKQEDPEITKQPNALFNDKIDGVEWSVTEGEPTRTVESIEQASKSYDTSKSGENSDAQISDGLLLVLLVILAIIIPPLAVFIYEGATQRFWIDLILALIGLGLGLGLGGLAYLAALAAVIYALLIVLGVI